MTGERRNFLGRGNDAFTCLFCGEAVRPLAGGGFRNHCPCCLWSRHVDEVPGDRAAGCGALMEPVALEGSTGSGWTVVHRCVACAAVRPNRVALDDPQQPDDWSRLCEILAGG